MKKKHLVIVGVIILSAIVILGLYQTFALSGDITKDTSGYHNVTITDGTTVTVPASSTKTVYYKLTNTNNGVVQYGVGYSGTNITVKYYNDTQDPVTGTVAYGKSKFIKLSVENTGTTSSTATLSTILGYEKGGDLIVPSGVTLVTKAIYDTTLIQYITEDNYTPDITVKNNGISYEYDTTNDLMKDTDGNIRYYGANPNNYIYFNCDDYTKQSSSTCELWRIIGFFDGKIKIMRNEYIRGTNSIAQYPYNSTNSNDWTTSSLMKLLNPNFSGTDGSLYWNRANGTCTSNSTTSCNFTSTGLKGGKTKQMIVNATWNIGGLSNSSIYPDQAYTSEKSATTQNYVALPSASDYGYAADLNLCKQQLNNYSDSTCTSNNWMRPIMGYYKNYEYETRLLNKSSTTTNTTFIVAENGFVDTIDFIYDDVYATTNKEVVPALYLSGNVVKVGDPTTAKGSINAPFEINIFS